MSSTDDAEVAAFLAWLSTFKLSRPVATRADLSDGAALFDVLSTVSVYLSLTHSHCVDYFVVILTTFDTLRILLHNSLITGHCASPL
jgi:hypothetical protein